jgi:GST-like protein
MLRFYYSLAPNPMKVALYLEEAGLAYEAVPVDTRKGEQHKPDFLAINPNAKAPAITDDGKPVFDSNAILLYLAEKTGQFLPAPELRGETLSWMFFISSGIGPYSGQAVHFTHHAPEKIDYAIKRYAFEAKRHWSILNDRLEGRDWLVGDSLSAADLAVIAQLNALFYADEAHVALDQTTHVKAWLARVDAVAPKTAR